MKFDNIDVDIKDVQNIEFEILLEFDRICKKNNIKYQLFAGTLLGCIRHKGFIPWDDDIDICMTRGEYNKFLDIASSELNIKYFMQTYETDKNYFKQLGRIRKNNTLYLQKGYQFVDMHHGVSISLMPLDNVIPNKLIGKAHRIAYQFLFYFLVKLNGSRSIKSCVNRDNAIEKVIRLILFGVSKFIPKKLTDRLHTKVACMFNNQETEYITHLTNGATKKRVYAYMMKRKDFYDVIEGDFEGHKFPIPRNFHSALTNLYGDYMKLPPEEKQKPHHGVVKVSFNTKLDGIVE